MKKSKPLSFRALVFPLFLLLGLVFALPAAAQSGEVVKIGYIDYDGFITPQEDGNVSGYGVDYLNKIASYTGWQYEYVYDTWDNQLQNLANGDIDFICHAQITPEREETYLFSKYSTGSESSILYVKEDDSRYYYNDYENFDGMRIAFLANSFQNSEFISYAEKHDFDYSSVYFETSSDAFRALNNGVVDAVAMGSLTGRVGYKIVARFGSDPFYFMTGKQNETLLNELNNALGQISAETPYYQSDLYKKYYGSKDTAGSTPLTREEAAYIAEAGVLEVGLARNNPPLSYTDENGNPAGITVDIMNLVGQKCGIRFTYSFLSAGQTGMDYLSSQPDTSLVAGVMSSAFSTPNPALLQTAPLLSDTVVFVGKSGMSFDPRDSLTVALPAAFIGGEAAVQTVYPTFRFIHCTDSEDCLTAIRDGRADVMLQNIYVARQALQSPQYEALEIFPAYAFEEEMKAVALPQNQILVSILDKTLEHISSDDINSIVIEHTIGKTYVMTANDILYKYRTPIVALTVLFFTIIILSVSIILIRQRSLLSVEAANTSLAQANNQLAFAVDSANRANRAKSLFLSRMSHEIRTPMNAIVGITAIARSHVGEPDKITEYLGKIDVSSKVLLNIINDVLDMSAIESDKLKIADAEFDMREVLSGISTLYYTQCRQKGIDFVMAANLPNETYRGDALRVNQILLNLVSNAFKFTEAGGAIKVLVSEDECKENISFLRFEVADTGAGMTEEMQQRLFKPFEQESATTAQRHGGSGLGMSIAKNLVDMMHGAITVKSEKGVGSTFTVTIPFKIAQQLAPGDAATIHEQKVLLVDADEQSRETSAMLFDRIGVQYQTAASGEGAIELLRSASSSGTPFDLCFIDLKMSARSNFSVLRGIRAEHKNDGLCIVVCAYDITEIEEPAIAAGADLFISKPMFQSSVFDLLMERSGGKYTRNTAKNSNYDFTGKRVLLAEDNEMNREITVELLGMVHMACDCAVNGRIAVDMFAASRPHYYDAILMDVQMPEMDGHAATRAIRALSRPDAREIPILAMTANAFEEDISAALSAGMNGHIAKPIDTEVLYKTLQKYCG